MLLRKTSVCGLFYPSNKKELFDMIKGFMDKVELSNEIYKIKSVVCPHAGYVYSGQVAAYSYKAILNNWNNLSNKTFVILCPSHYASFYNVVVSSFDKLETPFGNLSVAKELGQELVQKYPEYFTENNNIFEKEHSLEVQLPFLKYIAGESDIKVLPLIFGGVDFKEVGKILNTLYKNNDLFFIVSSDLSHYKDYFNASNIDRDTINYFLTTNTGVIAKSADACGIYPWITLNELVKENNWKPKLLKYLNSGDTAGDKNRVVGYASIVYL